MFCRYLLGFVLKVLMFPGPLSDNICLFSTECMKLIKWEKRSIILLFYPSEPDLFHLEGTDMAKFSYFAEESPGAGN